MRFQFALFYCALLALHQSLVASDPDPDAYAKCVAANTPPDSVDFPPIPDKNQVELLLVLPIWRHGDRWPTTTYASDSIQQGNWTGGFGQLSPCGMYQHLVLGKLLRQYYTQSQNFISDVFDARQIYPRSTDVNRTIISAISNLLGMFSAGNPSKPGVDYPDDPSWPKGFIPIALHTVPDDTDYIGNPDGSCPRQDELVTLLNSGPDMTALVNNNSQLFANLSNLIGEKVTPDNLWVMMDSINIESEYFPNDVPTWYAQWQAQTQIVNDQVENYQNGVGLTSPVVKGFDLSIEIPKIRGGSLINDFVARMQQKLDCYGSTSGSCAWINGLKYYILSAHDTTVTAYLTVLGAKLAVIPTGYPHYSAAVITELYRNKTDGSPLFRVLFHDNFHVGARLVTGNVTGCANLELCPFSALQAQAKKFNPGDIGKLCTTSTKSSSSITTNVLTLPFTILSTFLLLVTTTTSRI